MRTSPERDRKLSTTAREEPDINQRVLTLTVPIKKLTYLLYLFGPTRGVTAKYLVLRTRKLGVLASFHKGCLLQEVFISILIRAFYL